MWELTAVVELDEKGRVLIPAEIRKRFHSTRFKVSTDGRVVELEPLATLDELRGKFRHIIKSEWEELEEGGEEFVTKR